MSPPTVRRFDSSDPLPGAGLFVLEASAGTGKTHTIAQLVRRFVVEGDVPIGEVLAMTFGRSAAQELRDRIRRELRRFAAEATDPDRAARAQRALADFDSACLMTIHQFCTDAFARFGIRADADPESKVSEDLADLIRQAGDDAYLDLFAADPPLAGPGPDGRVRTSELNASAARSIASELASHPDAELITAPVHEAAPEQQRIDYAARVRQQFEEAKRRGNVVSYDDLVLRLRLAVQDPQAAARLRGRFRVVLIDEFQDTDPAQWSIVREAFLSGGDRGPVVVLIGDPKQGIYSFRGADIHAYTAARDTPGAVKRTLATNYRSDGPVVAGVLGLLQGLEVGDGIVVGPVDAATTDSRIEGPGVDADGRRVRLRVCRAPAGTKRDSLRNFVARDTAAEIARTIREGATLSNDGTKRPVRASDFAVIVRTNREAAIIQRALQRVGLPAVVNSQVSVYTSEAAEQWLALLRAMELPSGPRLRGAALGELVGTDPAVLAMDPDGCLAAIADWVAALSAMFREAGVPAVLAQATRGGADRSGKGLYERTLGQPDAQRWLTDLRHVAALLHEEQRRAQHDVTGLADWLAGAIANADSESPERAETLTRRLDTDAQAVQVVTIHRCKGLQYGIVYVPFGAFPSTIQGSAVVCTTELGTHPPRMRRVIDVRSYSSGSRLQAKMSPTDILKDIRRQQSLAEDLRMLYVALTRAIHEVVVTWAMAEGANSSGAPLHRALSAPSGVPAASYPSDPPLAKAEACPHVALELVPYGNASDGTPADPATDAPPPAVELVAAPYARVDIDTAWTRASFTGLTREAPRRSLDLADESALGEKDDEPAMHEPIDVPDSTMADLPAGTAFGTLVHAVLEHVDTAAADLAEEVRRKCREQLQLRPMPGVDAEVLAGALTDVLNTPLGRLAPAATLARVSPADRLPELDFELPMHSQWHGASDVSRIGALLADASAEPEWVRQYGQQLRGATFSNRKLRGYLVGSIDAVLRIEGRCYVVDYKTNRLGTSLTDYRPESLPTVMAEAHYLLQGLLYNVALHRYLRLRQPGYEPQQHLGGILYLFVRAMIGPDTPMGPTGDPYGVFAWRPSVALIEGLSALMGGERL